MSVSLSSSQLEKPYHSNHEFYGLYQDRGERFLEKIEKQEPFEITDGSSVTIDKFSPGIEFLQTKQYKQLGGGKKLFKTEIGDLSLSQFVKTQEFGSNNGQGAGSKNTAIQESTQCVFNSMLRSLEKTYLDVEDITLENISSSYQYCNTTTPWEEIYEFSQIPNWQQSFLTSSNTLQEYLGEMEYENHRDSLFIDNIYNSAKLNVNYQLDKWNPADIWLIKDSVLNTRFSSSLDELNNQLEDMFDRKELIGVSLKKLGKEPKIEVKNKKYSYKKQYNYLGYKTTYKSKDIKLLYDGGQICFRTFNYGTNWAGEILGKTASHGKIGFGAINSILKKYNIGLKTTKEIKIYCETTPYNQLLHKLLENFIGLETKFNIFIQDKNIDWRVSKLLGLFLLDNIESQPKVIQNKIITEFINYASSELDESSVFLKLS
jgi:hypothetical protein